MRSTAKISLLSEHFYAKVLNLFLDKALGVETLDHELTWLTYVLNRSV